VERMNRTIAAMLGAILFTMAADRGGHWHRYLRVTEYHIRSSPVLGSSVTPHSLWHGWSSGNLALPWTDMVDQLPTMNGFKR
jgi:hypothetical protein